MPSHLGSWFGLRIVFGPSVEIAGLVHRLRLNVEALKDLSDAPWPETMRHGRALPAYLLHRQAELTVVDRAAISIDLVAIAGAMEDDMRQAGRQTICWLYGIARTSRHGLTGMYALPGLYEALPFGPQLLERAGRRAMLDASLAWHESVSRCVDLRAVIAAVRSEFDEERQRPQVPLPGLYLRQHWSPAHMHVAYVGWILHVRLLAAEFAGRGWPEDPFAPPGTPLHRVERGGALLGAWSVGKNGVPDGGNRRDDLCLSLSDQALGRPAMGDALPPEVSRIQGSAAPGPFALPLPPSGPATVGQPDRR